MWHDSLTARILKGGARYRVVVMWHDSLTARILKGGGRYRVYVSSSYGQRFIFLGVL